MDEEKSSIRAFLFSVNRHKIVGGDIVLADRRKVTSIKQYNRFAWLNIGTILFGAIFIYMIITLFSYLTAKHTASYEVTVGSISGNYR